MGMCFPCPGEASPPSPDLEEKRAKLAEAAERRQKEAASRGILDVRSVEEKRKKKEKIEKQIAASGPPSEGGLRVSIKTYLRFNLLGMLKNVSSNLFNNFLLK
uniref:Small VCP interacting protein n=2 Tax=Suricata suricatta TaxID=37032 RepID=A0A673UD87_SURSU